MDKGWNVGGKLQKGLLPKEEYAVLVGVIHKGQREEQLQEYLDELAFLATTAGATCLKQFTQRMDHPDSRTFIGKGKLEELEAFVKRHEEVSMVIFDDDLTGKQVNTLESILKVKILDRSFLILDIFASRAQTAQAKTQVELAQLQYLLPRLRGLWTHLERQKGGIGMRGPGEKEMETDRRIVRDKVSQLRKKLEQISRQDETRRKNRGELIRVALVGYTNVGKSTLMNVLSKSEVFAENKLFATLDTTVRKVVLDEVPFLLSDTVGFIRKLPHHLVESFQSTLDEVRESDLLLHVVDVAHPQHEDHIRTVRQTLLELGVGDKPTWLILNKFDLFRQRNFDEFLDEEGKEEVVTALLRKWEGSEAIPPLLIAASAGENLGVLRQRLVELVKDAYRVRYPYHTGYR